MPTKIKSSYGTLRLEMQKSWTGTWSFKNVLHSFSTQTQIVTQSDHKVEYSHSHFLTDSDRETEA